MQKHPTSEYDIIRSDRQFWMNTRGQSTHTPPMTIQFGASRTQALPCGSSDDVSVFSDCGTDDADTVYVLGVNCAHRYVSLTRVDIDDESISDDATILMQGEDATSVLDVIGQNGVDRIAIANHLLEYLH